MFERIREDIACILERDPAARSRLEIVTCYPGLHAILVHRMAHRLWGAGWHWLGRFVSHLGRILTGIEIHPGATLGRRVFIDHGHGVVIGETAQVGDDCTIYQGVTLGGTRLYKGEKRHPTLGKGVVVGAGAKVLGGFTVGDGARIGSNAVVVRPVPDGATAVGNPARIIEHKDPVEQTKQTVTEQARQEASRATERALDREFEVCCDEGKLDTEPLQALLSSQGSKVIADKTAPGSTASVQIGATTPAAQDSVAGAPAGSESGQPEFTAYAVDTGDTDPLIKVVQELIDHAAHQDARIAQLCQAIESLGKKVDNPENGALDAERLNRLVE